MTWLTICFLFIMLLTTVLSTLGLLLAADLFDRLHYLGPVSVVGSMALLLAVLFHEGISLMWGRTLVVVLIMIATGPVVSHAIARAAVIRGDARRLRDEEWEVSE